MFSYVDTMEETNMEMVSREKMKPDSRYKMWLEGGGGAGFGRVYHVRWGSTFVWHGCWLAV